MPFKEITLFIVTVSTLHGQFCSLGSTALLGPKPLLWGSWITLLHTTLGRTSGRETGPSQISLYLTTLDTHKRQTSMPPAGFETTIPASEQPQTHALDRSATGIATWASDNTGDTYVALWQPVREALCLQRFTACCTVSSRTRIDSIKSPALLTSNWQHCTPGADKSLARPTSRCILFDGENISFDASLVLYI
jgi:hypothetical protein